MTGCLAFSILVSRISELCGRCSVSLQWLQETSYGKCDISKCRPICWHCLTHIWYIFVQSKRRGSHRLENLVSTSMVIFFIQWLIYCGVVYCCGALCAVLCCALLYCIAQWSAACVGYGVVLCSLNCIAIQLLYCAVGVFCYVIACCIVLYCAVLCCKM